MHFLIYLSLCALFLAMLHLDLEVRWERMGVGGEGNVGECGVVKVLGGLDKVG